MNARWHLVMVPSLVASLLLLLGSQAIFLHGSLFQDLRLGRLGSKLTLANYAAIFADQFYLDSVLLTVRLAGMVAVVTLVCAYPVAFVLARMRSRWSLVMLALLLATSFITIVIKVLGLIIIFSANGKLNQLALALGLVADRIPFLGSAAGVMVGLLHFTLGFAVMLLFGVIRTIPRSLEDAAHVHGANRFRVFQRIIVPLSLPGIIVTALIVFNLCMGAFASAALIGGGRIYTLPVLIQQTVILDTRYAMGATLSTILLVLTLTINLISVLLVSRLQVARRVVA